VAVEAEDVGSRVRELTGGGAEIVVDTTPFAPESLNHAIAIAVRRGRIVLAGLKGRRPARELPVDDTFPAVESLNTASAAFPAIVPSGPSAGDHWRIGEPDEGTHRQRRGAGTALVRRRRIAAGSR
jgi:NADPH:quinone reductase-like Zn-dependent oxidoreductase